MATTTRERVAAIFVFMLCAAVLAVVYVMRNSASHLDPHQYKRAPIGWVAVGGSIAIFGSYSILIKSDDVQRAQVDPFVFQVFFSVGVVLCNSLVFIVAPWYFSWWGVLAAGMWVLTSVG